jgi:hypothetical protein
MFMHDPKVQLASSSKGSLFMYSLANPLSLLDEGGLTATLPRRSDLVKQLATIAGQNQMMSWMPAYHRPGRTDIKRDRCHNDLADFLKRALGTHQSLVASYPQIWVSSLNNKPLGNSIWTAFDDRIEPSSAGNWKLSIRQYGGAGWQKHITLRPGMTIHYAREADNGRWGSKHFIMWLGNIPGKPQSEGYYFDSLGGKMHRFVSSASMKIDFFRVTRVNDPWHGKE